MAKVIKVENLSKAYQLGDFGTGTISRDLERFWARMRGKEDPYLKIGEENDRTCKGGSDVVWSLKGLDFDVERGDAVGIIGRNGAGKSTLLKILSRVTSPTLGTVRIKGRIASLLEVGTGFHPELTGRENIFLNGAILGMRKAEIKRKFEEIVNFAGVERYVDTPVKRYSSGMYVRLAFAVAAHLESEILVVDEVLAVGDADFQKKCLGKMGEVTKDEGRTILFVSHNMASINQLCNTCLLLHNGKLEDMGETRKVVDHYLMSDYASTAHVVFDNDQKRRTGNQKVIFTKAWLNKPGDANYTRVFSLGQSLHLSFSLQFNNPNLETARTSVEVKTADGLRIANMIDTDSGFEVRGGGGNLKTYQIIMEDLRLYPGTYYLSLYAGDTSSTEIYDYLEDCISFEIIDGGILTNRALPRNAGLIYFTPTWEIKDESK